jgi:hypothetical protein
MTLTRFRNLSDEGLRLYNASIRTTKNRNFIKRLIHNIFWTRYDDKLLEISNNCRESSYTLFSLLDTKLTVEYTFNSGLRNIVKAILTPKNNSKNKWLNVKQNYLFHLDLISKSHQTGDYNTVILCLLALQHPYITRLNIFNKKIDRKFKEMDEHYGNISNGFIQHFHKIIKNNCSPDEIPAIFIYLIYCQDVCDCENIRFSKSNITITKKQILKEIYELYHYFNIRKNFLSELYRSKISDKELYFLSNNIQPFEMFHNETINPLFQNETINPLNTIKLN